MLVTFIERIGWYVVGQPLFYLYMSGPTWLGGWKSKSEWDICAQMTSVDASFWSINQAECSNMIEKDFHSVLTVVQVMLYVWILHGGATTLYYRYVFRSTILDMLNDSRFYPLMTAIVAGSKDAHPLVLDDNNNNKKKC